LLFVSDLDGTLVDRRATLSRFAVRTLRRLIDEGVLFTVASARSQATLAPILRELPLTLPIIEFNGAYITDLATGQSLYCEALDAEVATCAVRLGLDADVPPFVSTHFGGQQYLYPPEKLRNAGMTWYVDTRKAALDRRLLAGLDPFEALAQPAVCLTFIAEHARLAVLKQRIDRATSGQTNSVVYRNPYDTKWFWLTVQSARANKGDALRKLTEHLGVALSAVTVFGDEVNDIPMFEVAGRCVAVDNAVPELKRLAHQVIGAHHLDSVVQYLSDANKVAG
jgi:Cof subfamily protein (haloacid dehalogenase superfamily)